MTLHPDVLVNRQLTQALQQVVRARRDESRRKDRVDKVLLSLGKGSREALDGVDERFGGGKGSGAGRLDVVWERVLIHRKLAHVCTDTQTSKDLCQDETGRDVSYATEQKATLSHEGLTWTRT